MKPLKDLRLSLPFHPSELNTFLWSFNKADIDWDVYLPDYKTNLQRDYVWNLHQKREIIWSILKKRNIPRMSMIYTISDGYEVIDGKQRLSSMLDYLNNKFSLLYEGKEYFYEDLPTEHQIQIRTYAVPYYVVNEDHNGITDDDKVTWFKFINFAGTAQDRNHLDKLKK